MSVVSKDNNYLLGKTYEDCLKNITGSIIILHELGFMIKPIKSCLTPKQKIAFLGFEIDSCSMSLTLTKGKKGKIKSLCKQLLTFRKICLRELASVIVNIAASFTIVSYGSLYYKSLEKDRLEALKISKLNYDTNLTLSNDSISELPWWVNNTEQACRYLTTTEPDLTIYTDASM